MTKITSEKVIVWADGGSRGNPGPAAIGIVIKGYGIEDKPFDAAQGKEYSEYIGEATNNEAEYRAVIFGLKKVKALVGKANAGKQNVEIRLDSELVAKQMQGRYKILEHDLQSLFIELWNLKQDFGEVGFKIVPRSENGEADRLVNEALDREEKPQSLFN